MTVLHVSPDAPAWAHVAADALLVLHIGGGAVGIISGATALLTRKGAPVHRAAGTVFFVSMLIAYTVAGGVAPFLEDGQRPNFVAAILALYLLSSGWRTAHWKELAAGRFEVAGLIVALLIVAGGALFMRMGAASPSGTVDGSPPQAFYIFIAVGAAGALGDLHLIVRRRLSGAARIARHLWRMCFSLFIAAGSFFLGQQQVMPEWMRGSPVLIALALAPLGFMLFWLIRVRFADWRRTDATPEESAYKRDSQLPTEGSAMNDQSRQHDIPLTILTLLSIFLVSLHLTDDVVRGYEPGDITTFRGVLVLAVWLFGALALPGTRLGYFILLLGSVLGIAVSLVHLRGDGVGGAIADSDGGFLFIWTLIALGVTATVSLVLSACGLWRRLLGRRDARKAEK